ncbi:MAG: 3-dehydroquinate synthase [Actinomycetota bacterium]
MKRTDLPAPPLPPGRPNIVLTGFMGTGKSTSGPPAAELLDLEYVDLDRRQERIAGMALPRIFEELGEPAFREIERRAIVEAVALSASAIASGGGAAPLHPEQFAKLSEGNLVVVLTSTPEAIAGRVGDAHDRPLLTANPEEQIRKLLAERAEAYAAAGEQVETTDVPAEETAKQIVELYRKRAPEGLTRIEVAAPGHGPVILGDGAIGTLGSELSALLPDARKVGVVSDPNARDAGESAAESISSAGMEVVRIPLPSGEAAKGIAALAELLTAMRENGIEPTDVVVAVGGGATLDAAGFAAATYARGIALVNMPTTLLAMVDAGLGGKVAIDHAGAKNLVGTFHPPRLVLADPSALGSLPEGELRTGFAEIVKAAMLASPLFLDWLEAEDPMTNIGWVIEQAVRIKAGYVAADPRDRGVRKSLNLGHTFAHAIESASGYEVSHGEAVSAGLIAAARLGVEHGVTDARLPERLASMLERLGLPQVAPKGLEPDALVSAMAADKKRSSGEAVFVVPTDKGAALLAGIEPAEAVSHLDGGRA